MHELFQRGSASRCRVLITTLALGLLMGAAPAGAVTFFTLDAPVALNQGGVSGSINPVTDYTGSILLSDVGGNLLSNEGGALLLADVFVVDISLDAGSATVDGLGFTVGTPNFFLNPLEAGAFDDTASGDVAPSTVTADNLINFAADFVFGTPLAGNQQSVRLFATYSPGGEIEAGQQVNFMVSSGTNFTPTGTVVPEPATAVLLGGALALLAFRARRGTRSA